MLCNLTSDTERLARESTVLPCETFGRGEQSEHRVLAESLLHVAFYAQVWGSGANLPMPQPRCARFEAFNADAHALREAERAVARDVLNAPAFRRPARPLRLNALAVACEAYYGNSYLEPAYETRGRK